MVEIYDLSTEELQEEIYRREREDEENKSNTPTQVVDADIGKLKAVCQKYVDTFDYYGHAINDMKMEIFYVAMETFFGNNIWLHFDPSHSQNGRYVGKSIKDMLVDITKIIKQLEDVED